MPLRKLSDVTKAELRELQSVEFAKFVACYAHTNGSRGRACQRFVQEYDTYGAMHIKKELDLIGAPDETFTGRAVAPLITKAAAAAATTSSGTWAGPLVGVEQLMFGFLAVAHSASVLGKIPGLRPVPFGVSVPMQTQEATFAWVQEGNAKPAAMMAFASATTLALTKAAGITAYTREFLRRITNETAIGLRDSLKNTLVAFQDRAFLSADAAVTNTKPKGILNGVVPVTSTGNLAVDLQTLLNTYYAAWPQASEDTVLIASPAKSAQLKTLNSGGGPGYPVITTGATPHIIVCDGRATVIGDGGLELSVSESASVQMVDNPASPPVETTVYRSLWQFNETGIRLERTLNWYAVPGSVQVLATP